MARSKGTCGNCGGRLDCDLLRRAIYKKKRMPESSVRATLRGVCGAWFPERRGKDGDKKG